MFFVSYPTTIIYSNSTYIVVPMMRSIQLKLIQIKQGFFYSVVVPFTQSVCHNANRWISSLGSTELKWVHNRVDPGFDSLLEFVGASTHYLLI
mgnify:CR=1 FL=1